jgi:predicted nuclease of restriction endonuclease-like (RecB) superfamily
MRIEDNAERDYYITEASEQNWNVKLLERNIRSGYYRRLLSTQRKSVALTTRKEEKTFEHIKEP